MAATPNQVSAVLSAPTVTSILADIADLRAKLPFIVTKTSEERQNGFKLSDHTVAFLNKARSYAVLHPDWIPTEVNNTEWSKDADLISPLSTIRNELRSLLEDVDATLGEVGFEELDPSVKFYTNVHLKAYNHVPGAKAIYEDMNAHFPGRKNLLVDLADMIL